MMLVSGQVDHFDSKQASHHATVSFARTTWSPDLKPNQEDTVVFRFFRELN
jgi:hypothetical protein